MENHSPKNTKLMSELELLLMMQVKTKKSTMNQFGVGYIKIQETQKYWLFIWYSIKRHYVQNFDDNYHI